MAMIVAMVLLGASSASARSAKKLVPLMALLHILLSVGVGGSQSAPAAGGAGFYYKGAFDPVQ